jgi:hypothetical protein
MHPLTKRRKPAIFLACLSTLVAATLDQTIVLQSAAQETAAPAPKPVDPERLREDFRILRQALEQGHSGIYRYTAR